MCRHSRYPIVGTGQFGAPGKGGLAVFAFYSPGSQLGNFTKGNAAYLCGEPLIQVVERKGVFGIEVGEELFAHGAKTALDLATPPRADKAVNE